MAPGGLVLVDAVGRHLNLQPGQSVLDLGCGQGQSSVYLAARYDVSVISVDLWIAADERQRAATAAGLAHRITPWQGDIRRGLPPETPPLDAIACVQAFHAFGTSPALVRYLATLLRPGGAVCIAQGCFSEEPGEMRPPFTDTDGWDVRYDTYHSPAWWRAHVEASGAFDVEACAELEDGDVMWEDDVLYRGDRAGWSADYMSRAGWLMRHIRHGQTSRPRLTHLMLKAVRRTPGAYASDTLDTPGVQP